MISILCDCQLILSIVVMIVSAICAFLVSSLYVGGACLFIMLVSFYMSAMRFLFLMYPNGLFK
jgi:hypothetical protein